MDGSCHSIFFCEEGRKKKEAEALSLAAEAGQAREQLLVVGVCHSSAEHITWMGHATESFSAGQAREQLL